MSLNLHVKASGMVITPNGKSKLFEEEFRLNQTTTEQTDNILANTDKVAAYHKYGYSVCQLQQWLNNMVNCGFKIIWYVG